MSNNVGPCKSAWPRIAAFAFGAILVIGGLLVAAVVVFAVVRSVLRFEGMDQLIGQHFAGIVGLPCAAALALALVMFLRSSYGPIEFEGLGFKFSGSSGPIVMWIACFMAITISMRMVWNL